MQSRPSRTGCVQIDAGSRRSELALRMWYRQWTASGAGGEVGSITRSFYGY
jgi:hypothetical protein